jgi:hypothetical protein
VRRRAGRRGAQAPAARWDGVGDRRRSVRHRLGPARADARASCAGQGLPHPARRRRSPRSRRGTPGCPIQRPGADSESSTGAVRPLPFRLRRCTAPSCLWRHARLRPFTFRGMKTGSPPGDDIAALSPVPRHRHTCRSADFSAGPVSRVGAALPAWFGRGAPIAQIGPGGRGAHATHTASPAGRENAPPLGVRSVKPSR